MLKGCQHALEVEVGGARDRRTPPGERDQSLTRDCDDATSES
jgi:hypothetical protein